VSKPVPDCTGLPEAEALARLAGCGYPVRTVRYAGFRALDGADGLCVVRQRLLPGGKGGPEIELLLCDFKRGVSDSEN
jgi:hypothetical protein